MGLGQRLRGMLLACCLGVGTVAAAAPAGEGDVAGLLGDGRLMVDRGEFQQALVLAERALALAGQDQGGRNPGAADVLMLMASANAELDRHAQAMAQLEQALALRESILGPQHPMVAETLTALGAALRAAGRYEQALAVLQRALLISESTQGPDHPATGDVLRVTAGVLVKRSRHAEGLAMAQRALAISEKAHGPDSVETALSLESVARILGVMSQHQQALPLNERALAIRERAQGNDHFAVAVSANDLGTVYDSLGRHQDALALKLRALAIHERVSGPEHTDLAAILGNIGYTYSAMGRFDLALPFFRRALAIREKALGVEHPDTAGSMQNLAECLLALAQYDEALPLQRQAQAVYERAFGPEHRRTAQGLTTLAGIHSRLGQHDQALVARQRAVSVSEKVNGTEHTFTANALFNLARSHTALQQPGQALPLQQRGLAIREKAFGAEHFITAMALNELAETQLALGQPSQALATEQRALAIREKVLGPSHVDTAASLAGLAKIRIVMGQHAQALPLLQQAESIVQQAYGPDHPSTAAALANLAALYLQLGDRPFAVALLKQSVNAQQVVRERVAGIGDAELRSYTGMVASTYQKLAEALTDEGRLPEAQLVLDMLKEDEQFDFIRRSESNNAGRTRIGYNPSEQAWALRYRQIADRLAALGAEEQALVKAAKAKPGLSAEQKQRQQALGADLAVAQSAFGSFLVSMREDFARKGVARQVELAESSTQALAELRELLRGLGEGAVLLQVYLTDDRVNLLLTTPGVQLARSSAISAPELNRQIAQFRRLLRDPGTDPLPTAQALYRLLMAPVVQDLAQAGAKTVMLSLDGALRYLPFGALHDGQQYLVQRWSLPLYTSVTRDRLRDAVAPQWQAAGLGLTRKLGDFDPLPGVRAEMDGIIRSAFAGPGAGAATGALPGEVHLDEAFTAQRLRDVSQRRFPVLHVASHFRFSPGTEVNSFLLLGDGQQLSLGELRTHNYRFDNVDLLTLSACDTGLGGGRDERGREIEGFGVIAQQQGARAVLATLWPVADQSTAQLMADLYRRRQAQQLSKVEALRQAQLALQAQARYGHPFYWAPFILMGNWL